MSERIQDGSAAERVGFIGLGLQGAPIARRIAAEGFPLTVWARRPEAAEPFAKAGANVAGSIQELAGKSDHVGICVVNDRDVLDVCEQLLPSMRRGARLAIHSTVLPETIERLGEICDAQGIALIDAPVSGGPEGAENRTLTIMCGASAADYEAALPVFKTFAGKMLRLGPPGAGQRAKIVNNALMAAHMGLAHAAFSAARSLEIDTAALAELVAVSSGRSYGFDIYASLSDLAHFSAGAVLLRKDIGLLEAVVPQGNGAGPLAAAAHGFLSEFNVK
ncbi:NAD(P)-dependent oxidoreductase [Novosphingobium malaysiense]|uniref:6-phosphogluconate dehydrogenase n=1 Tax=Novosphingobium malaysiense TaxID=1348853 RepID=A0A0B1ZH19_9SPHN|nr:NAD(P)-dependent oxidoreductase [Novosphingobium malaysiense]KHK90406.1 6-phosphogluconate dehydrogenase [Novosphingobium malaysiense]